MGALRTSLAIALSTGLLYGGAAATEFSARAWVDTTAIRPGELVRLTIEAIHDPGLTITFPEPGEGNESAFVPGFLLRDAGAVVGDSLDASRSRRSYEFVSYRLDTTLVIPPMAITAHGGDESGPPAMAATEALSIDVVGAIEDGAAVEPQPERPPVSIPIPFPWLKWLTVGLLLGLVAWLAQRWWRRRRRSTTASAGPPRPIRPPHEVALEALQELKASPFRSGEPKPFYTALTDIVRNYLAGRFHVDAPDLTTDEVIDALTGRPVESRARSLVRNLLREADLVKFAKLTPEASQWEDRIATATTVVEMTRPVESPEVADES